MILVCEGACSPSTPEYDRAAQDYQYFIQSPPGVLDEERVVEVARHQHMLLERVLTLASKMVHTRHSQVAPDGGFGGVYQCATCGAKRVF